MNHAAPAPVQVIRHVAFEDVGTLGDELHRAELPFEYIDAPSSPVSDARDARLVIVLGGPVSANDSDRFRFLEDEVELLRYRMRRDLPTLGICLGAQLIARALGSRVFPMQASEIGWGPLTLTEAGGAGPLRHLTCPVLHWHGETFDLPDGCRALASTPMCANQAFAFGNRTLGLQFHIEVGSAQLERWLVGHVHELDRNGIDVRALRADARIWAGEATVEGRKLFRDWLAACGIRSAAPGAETAKE